MLNPITYILTPVTFLFFVSHFTASFLQTRFWNGLEQKLGQTEVVDAVEGRTGIASGYTHEMDDTGIEHNESPGD